jgi:hypothetical protein
MIRTISARPLVYSWPLFRFLFSTEEHLKVTTCLLGSISRSPVSGFLPLCLPFCFTQNLPNPVIRASSPPSRVFLIISKLASTALADAALDMSRRSKTERVMASLVRVMKGAFYIGLDGSPKAPGFEEICMRSWVCVNGIDIQEEIGRQ